MNTPTPEDLVAFEARIARLFAEGELPFLIHLSGGNEGALHALFNSVIHRTDWVLSTHRNHYHALLHGIPAEELEAMIRDGRSMFVFGERFLTSSILAGVCPIACGLALAEKMKGSDRYIWCFLGDGAEDNGHFYEAARFAAAHKLRLHFIIEDNNRQVDTSYAARWGSLPRPEYADLRGHVTRMSYDPQWPHAGAGLPPGSVTFKPERVREAYSKQWTLLPD